MGFGGGFLMISPPLRRSLAEGLEKGARGLDQHGPWSYVGVGLFIVLAFMLFVSRASAPR
jgi:hypothetical protein